jgi:U4/U6.U5 tri-snRNP-associated protein 2
MTLPELRTLASAKGISLAGCVERSDVEARLHELLFAPLAELLATKYDLLANVCHDSPPGTDREASKQDPLASGSYRVHVLQNESDQWFEIEDLHVQETMPQLIGLSESYLMVYERKRADAKK